MRFIVFLLIAFLSTHSAYAETVPTDSGTPCPANYAELKPLDAEGLHQCKALHADICREFCGARYDKSEVRNFIQTGGKPGLVCLDISLDETKNGVLLSQDPSRKDCTEQHQGKMRWCIKYQSDIKASFGPFLQCAGRIE
jgi:hypothetical protein